MTNEIISCEINSDIADGGRHNPQLPLVSLLGTGAVSPAIQTNGRNLSVGQFQDLRDTSNLIKSKPGMFWCYTHLADLPLEKQSPDPRYCQECFELFLHEVDDMKSSGNHHKSWWMLRSTREKTVQVVEQLALNMSTVNSQKTTVDKLYLSVPVRLIVHPGPKKKELPMDLITQLVSEGQGSKIIAKRLTSDGISVSYKTIQRLLKKVKA